MVPTRSPREEILAGQGNAWRTINYFFAASNRYQALPFFRFFQLPLSFPGISAPFILSNKDDEDFEIGFDGLAPVCCPSDAESAHRHFVLVFMSCLSIGSAGCL